MPVLFFDTERTGALAAKRQREKLVRARLWLREVQPCMSELGVAVERVIERILGVTAQPKLKNVVSPGHHKDVISGGWSVGEFSRASAQHLAVELSFENASI